MKEFDIKTSLPSGNIATFHFYTHNGNSVDLNYVYEALYAHAKNHSMSEPQIIERVNKVITHKDWDQYPRSQD